jgi:protein SCO1
MGLVLASCGGPPGPPPGSVGALSNRQVPLAINRLPLTDQYGTTVHLTSWPGRTVVVVPFLTLCTDICPLTTGNLLQVKDALRADAVAQKVQIVELSVDPGRDTPARLAAYAKLTGATWQLVTESPAVLQAVARYFGFFYERVPEDDPPSIDWWTGRPLTYDINHSDGFVIVDPHGTERFVTDAAPNFHGQLTPKLYHFLSDEGLQHLAHPARPNWTPDQLLAALGWVLGQSLPGGKAS